MSACNSACRSRQPLSQKSQVLSVCLMAMLAHTSKQVPIKYRAACLGASSSLNQFFAIPTTIVGYFVSRLTSDLQWKIPFASE